MRLHLRPSSKREKNLDFCEKLIEPLPLNTWKSVDAYYLKRLPNAPQPNLSAFIKLAAKPILTDRDVIGFFNHPQIESLTLDLEKSKYLSKLDPILSEMSKGIRKFINNITMNKPDAYMRKLFPTHFDGTASVIAIQKFSKSLPMSPPINSDYARSKHIVSKRKHIAKQTSGSHKIVMLKKVNFGLTRRAVA